MHDNHNEAELRRMKRVALACVGFAAIVFITTLFLPPTFFVRLLKAGAEAAMVGGLADWFAVVALFRRPLGLPIPHTAIIPENKDRIADNLATFVREKFLQPELVAELVRRSNPAERMSAWFSTPSNARRVGRYSADALSRVLDVVDDKNIQEFMRDAARTMVGRMDFSRALGSVLETLTKGGRHQLLLEQVLGHITTVMDSPETREIIADRFARWLKKEYNYLEKILPTTLLGEKAASAAVDGLKDLLQEVADTPTHELRKKFDNLLRKFVVKLRTEPEFLAKGEQFKEFILDNPEFADYIRSIWADLRGWISADLEGSHPATQAQMEKLGLWLGSKLSQDPDLRSSINEHIESFATRAAPEFGEFLTRHISDTVRQWDAESMSNQIEQSIGPDLQYIRVSGTVVGGFIGVMLFLVSYLGEIF